MNMSKICVPSEVNAAVKNKNWCMRYMLLLNTQFDACHLSKSCNNLFFLNTIWCKTAALHAATKKTNWCMTVELEHTVRNRVGWFYSTLSRGVKGRVFPFQPTQLAETVWLGCFMKSGHVTPPSGHKKSDWAAKELRAAALCGFAQTILGWGSDLATEWVKSQHHEHAKKRCD